MEKAFGECRSLRALLGCRNQASVDAGRRVILLLYEGFAEFPEVRLEIQNTPV